MNHLQSLTRYKAWANKLLFAAVAELPESELIAPRSNVFGSLIHTLNHTYAMDVVWRAHLLNQPHGYTTRIPKEYPPLPELDHAQQSIDAWFVSYADSLSGTDRAEMVEFTFIGGDPSAMSREAILLHVVNHGTYHRGHAADIMADCSVDAPTTDYPVFLKSTPIIADCGG